MQIKDDESIICLLASRFVRKSRHRLANRIWETLCGELGEHNDAIDDRQAGADLLELTGEALDAPNDGSNFVYEAAKHFLFETEPILALEASVKEFVRSNVRHKARLPGRKFIRICLSNVMMKFRPPVGQGKHRISWKCVSKPPIVERHRPRYFVETTDCGHQKEDKTWP